MFIGKNTIVDNQGSGIYIDVAGDNIWITGNDISENTDNGISLGKIGSNIQSNVIYAN